MMRFLRWLPILTLLLAGWLLGGAVTPEELRTLSAAATLEHYPEADTVLLHDLQSVVLDEQLLGTETDDFYQKVLTDAGRQKLRELVFPFNATYQQFELTQLEVIRPDGTRRPVDVGTQGKVAISPGQMSSNIYDPANKVFTVAVPELAIGDILHVVTKVTEIKARIPGQWNDLFLLQSDDPLLYYEVVVDLPEAHPLRSVAVKDGVAGTVTDGETRQEGRIRYNWVARNVPQLVPEPDMPPLYTAAQRLLVSTARDWKEISGWYYRLCRPRLDAVTPEIKAMTTTLIAGCRTDEEKIMALFQFVSQKIRYMGVTAEAEAPGYEPHDVSLTFQQRYGVCRDKAALLVAMLEAAGFQAFPVLFMAGEPKDDEVPNNFFNHAIVAVETAPEVYQLMDPTYETTTELLPSTLSNMSYLVAKPDGDVLRRSPQIPAEKNLLRIQTAAAVTPAGVLKGSAVFEFSGVNDQMYRDAFSRWPREYRRQFFAAALKRAIPGAVLEVLEIRPENVRDMNVPLSVTLGFRAEEFLPENPREFLLQLPLFGKDFGAAGFVLGSTGLSKRKFKFEVFSTCGVAEEFKLALPPDCRVVELPREFEVSEPGIVRGSRKVWQEGAILRGTNFFSVDSVEITPPQYDKLKAALRLIDRAEQSLPIARIDFSGVKAADIASAFPNADLLVEEDTESVRLLDAFSWERVSVKKIRVLNYAGVKNASELKLPFNPVWESVEVTGAVIAPDGSRKELADLERNLMDAPWVSAAPRYPAGKILVANFPGVTPGSVIEYTVRRTCRERPFFSWYAPFAGIDPTTVRRYELTLPKELALKLSQVPVWVRSLDSHPDDHTVAYRWTAESIPALRRESGMAPLWLFAPALLLSTGNFEQYALSLDTALHRAAAKQPGVAALAAKLGVAGEQGVPAPDRLQERIMLIRDYVAQHIRAVGPGLNDLPLSALTDADVTLAEGYGNSADRAVLLAALLHEAGVEYRFVAVSSVPSVPKSLRELTRYPAPVFDSVLLFLPGWEIYLNDTDEYAVPGATAHEDRIGLDLANGKLMTIQPARNGGSQETASYSITLAADGSARLQVTLRYFGMLRSAKARFYRETVGEALRQHFEELAASFGQTATIVGVPEVDFGPHDNPGEVRLVLSITDFAALSGHYLQFELPGFAGLASLVNTADADRKNPFWRDSRRKVELEYEIKLPRNFRVVRDRPRRQELGEFGSSHFLEYFETGHDTLRIGCKLELSPELVEPTRYDELIVLQKELSKLSTRRVILTNRPE